MTAPIRHPLPIDDRRPVAVVIGSGFGGLAAAVRLGARGYRVIVLEKLEQAGGRASVFRQDGFTFDAGPTIITLPGLFEELWALCGRRLSDDVTMKAMNPFYRLRFADGTDFACSDDIDAMRAQVRRFNPADVEGYDRFLEESERIYGFAFEQLGHVPFHRLTTMAKAIPGFVRHRADRSVYSLVKRYFRDPRLRIAFSFHPLFIGGNPFSVTSLYALVSHLERRFGVHFAMGGTGSLVKGLVSLIEGQGGTIRLRSPVERIIVEDGEAKGVRLESGEVIHAAAVVSNADSAATYGSLLPPGTARRWTPAKLARADYSMSLFVWYVGTDRHLWPEVDHHTMLLGSALPRPARRHLPAEGAGQGFQPLPASPDGHRLLKPGAGGPRRLLRALARAAPCRRRGLGDVEAEAYRARIAAHLEATPAAGAWFGPCRQRRGS
jgi:phytoene desaturase